jgi:hypothetical protein
MAWEAKMSRYLPSAIGMVVLLIASSAFAKEQMALESASVGNARADCLGATTDGVVEASARIQFDAEAQRIIDEEKVWGRNPFQKAAEGEFGGVKSDRNAIANSVLNREAMSRISSPTIWPIASRFGDWKQVRGKVGLGWSPAAPGEGELPASKEIEAAESWAAAPLTELSFASEAPYISDLNVATDELITTEEFVPSLAFVTTSPVFVAPTFPMQWIELDASYPLPPTIKIQAC